MEIQQMQNKLLCSNSFIYIAQRILNKTGNIYTKPLYPTSFSFWQEIYEKEIPCDKESTVCIFFYLLISKIQYGKLNSECRGIGLFQILKETFHNIFINEKVKEEILDLFCKIQKTVHAFSRLAFLYKYKKAPYQIETDLYLTPISHKDKNVLTVYQNGNKFLFTVVDIIKIIKNAVCNTDSFFSYPVSCKNPYNKIPFNKSTLYNIYFFIKDRNYIMPEIIQKYFLSDFHLRKFQEDNNYIIREYNVDNYIYSITENDVQDYVDEMILFYNRYVKKRELCIVISCEFPKKKMKEIFNPYLQLYLSYRYSSDSERISQRKIELLCKLYAFAKFNRNFGKKKIRTTVHFFKNKSFETYFDDNHIPFHQNKIDVSKSHLEMIETIHNYEEVKRNINFSLRSESTNIHSHYGVDGTIYYAEDVYGEEDEDENENEESEANDLIEFSENFLTNSIV
jgi:hypothetical protein